jgi:gluconate 2-dehydrogenase gamma chain
MSDVRISRRTAIGWMGTVAALVSTGGASALAEYVHGQSAGYGKDPPLTDPQRHVWALTLPDEQLAKISALADTILPQTVAAKAASQVGVTELFNEWLSAPYPSFVADRELILPLLDRLPTNCTAPVATHSFRSEAAFERFRLLTAAAYYTSDEGMKAIGYIGNQPRATFDGPPATVLEHFAVEYRKL